MPANIISLVEIYILAHVFYFTRSSGSCKVKLRITCVTITYFHCVYGYVLAYYIKSYVAHVNQ